MTTYLKWTENNDYEGETWHFWLPIEGNETELDKLRAYLVAAQSEAQWDLAYTLGTEPTSEAEVDILVKHTNGGYMAYHNKIAGTLTVPAYEPDDDLFYKGGIRRFFTSNEPDQ